MSKLDNNILIAEFMGYKKIEDYYLLPINLSQFQNSDHGEWCSQYEVSFSERYWEIAEDNLNYHTSWDWLMPVVNKCKSFSLDNTYADRIDEALVESEIDFNYLLCTVLDFIKWYNENNNNKNKK